MTDSLTEPEIVRGLQNGDAGAWAALCQLHSERLWRYVARLIGRDSAAVADVFQETMLAVAQSGRRLREDSRLWSWLATIAHHQVALFWRKQARRSEQALIEDAAAQPETDQLEQQETVESVRRTLAELPADYVYVLTEKYTEGASAAQIAEQLGQSVEAVRSGLARARREFQERFPGDCPDNLDDPASVVLTDLKQHG